MIEFSTFWFFMPHLDNFILAPPPPPERKYTIIKVACVKSFISIFQFASIIGTTCMSVYSYGIKASMIR